VKLDVFLSICAMCPVGDKIITSNSPTSLKEDLKKIPEELSNWKYLKKTCQNLENPKRM